MKLTETEKQVKFDAINMLSRILWTKFQCPVSRYKKLSIVQMQYMINQLENTEKTVNDIYNDALKIF